MPEDKVLSGFLKLFRVHGAHWIGRSCEDGRLILVDLTSNRVAFYGRLPADCRLHFDVSSDGRMLATGYSIGPVYAIEIRNIKTGERIAESKKVPVDMMFGPSGRHLIIRGRGPAYVWDYAADKKRLLRFADNPSLGFQNLKRGEVVIPTWKKRHAWLIRWNPVRARDIVLPVEGLIWQIRLSPTGKSAIVSDNHGWVCGLSYPARKLIWRRRFDEGRDRICYSGDGKCIALSDLQKDGTFRVEVLDANCGQSVRILTIQSECTYPFKGVTVLSHRGEVVDLETGRVSSAYSDPHWWRSWLGGQPRVLA